MRQRASTAISLLTGALIVIFSLIFALLQN
jgi:hypothetical protein